MALWAICSLFQLLHVALYAAAKSFQSCPTLCNPTRLPCPWDSPGKNTGVGYHFLLQCMKVKSKSEVTQSCPTLSNPMDCSLPGSSSHGIFQARVALCTTTQKPPQTILNRWLCLCSNKTSLDSCAIVCQPQVQVIELTLY